MTNKDLRLTNGDKVLMKALNVKIIFVNTNSYEIKDSKSNEILLHLIKGNDLSLFITPTENSLGESLVYNYY